MSYYHIEGNGSFKNLPERILVREDGYLGAYKFYGEPIVDYWYMPEAENAKLKTENAKLRELVDELWAIAYGYVPYESELDFARDMMRELGVKVK